MGRQAMCLRGLRSHAPRGPVPWTSTRTVDELVTNVDLAPTIMELVSTTTGRHADALGRAESPRGIGR